ncbi:MAG TPA: pseudouridine synthase [Bacteroidota bacterium]|nr:pseudouridine synthase [Bacteroidota bacterium]
MTKTPRHISRDVSIARAISKLGYCSRKQAEELVLEGKVRLNGEIVRSIAKRCSLSHDKIAIEGQSLGKKQDRYIVMNKPAGVLTTRSDEKGRMTVYDVLGDIGKWVFPVGRLDRETTGLLILTNDHRFGELLTNPKSKISKTYAVELDEAATPDDIAIMEKGMRVDEEYYQPAKVKNVHGKNLEITIHEGKNRQVRRMFEHFGYTIVSLKRIAIGSFRVSGLKPGEWRDLKQEELEMITA